MQLEWLRSYPRRALSGTSHAKATVNQQNSLPPPLSAARKIRVGCFQYNSPFTGSSAVMKEPPIQSAQKAKSLAQNNKTLLLAISYNLLLVRSRWKQAQTKENRIFSINSLSNIGTGVQSHYPQDELSLRLSMFRVAL
jgi:hypothetical protein